MTIRKRLFSWCQKPASPLTLVLRRYSTPLAVVAATSILLVSFFILTSGAVFHTPPSTPDLSVSTPSPRETQVPNISIQRVPFESFQRQFNVNLKYAYLDGDHYGSVVLEFTNTSEQTWASDEGITEFYKVSVYSNEAIIAGNVIGCTIGKGIPSDYLNDLAISFGHVSISSSQGLTKWTLKYNSPNPTMEEPVTMSLNLMGWVEVNGTSVFSNLSGAEIVQLVTLNRYENGYLYNTLLTPQELSNADLSNPLSNPSLTTPSPTS